MKVVWYLFWILAAVVRSGMTSLTPARGASVQPGVSASVELPETAGVTR